MAAKHKKKTGNPKIKLTRKQQRKETRKGKKLRRNEYYTNRNKPGNFVLNSKDDEIKPQKIEKKPKQELEISEKIAKTHRVLNAEEQRKKEQNEKRNIEKQMQKQRRGQLLQANMEEDRNIKRLEKQLKLHKRNSKSVPKSFAVDGLDYLLEVCDEENMKNAVDTEKELNEVNDGFEEDFALMLNKENKNIKEKKTDKSKKTTIDDEFDDIEDFLNEDDDFDENSDDEDMFSDLENKENSENDSDSYTKQTPNKKKTSLKNSKINKKGKQKKEFSEFNEEIEFDSNEEESNFDSSDNKGSELQEKNVKITKNKRDKNKKGKQNSEDLKTTKKKKLKQNDGLHKNKKAKLDASLSDSNNSEEDSDLDFEGEENEFQSSEDEVDFKNQNEKSEKMKSKKIQQYNSDSEEEDSIENSEEQSDNSDFENSDSKRSSKKINSDGAWEDIYGRLRGKDGSVISKTEEKYIPPAIRAKMENNLTDDKKRTQHLLRLKKQLKGLLNRLAESNMHSITSQIEDLYMNNSRNDMNETLTSLIMESLISSAITPERLLMEHVLLIAVLHANVGTEIGAHFLQTVVRKFDEYSKANHEVENKMLDNIVNVLAQLYNFKLFDAKMLYEILDKLLRNFEEKDVECILHILRNVGFGLRKDDPLALKNLIFKIQKQAGNASEESIGNARVKFMLDVLLAIKNNNVTKIPNYDTSYSEHLKKIMKGFIRKGNYVTQLNISLDDLLKADERGKWWVVGSAWTGNNVAQNEENDNTKNKTEMYSEKLLELARKQRMNTDTRRNIFCIIMSAEDYLDAFEKLLKLGLKNQQEREIIHVILHCCLQEKAYNPYYSVLAQKFCEYDRKFQMTIKYSVWDKLKTLNDQSASQISNLAKLLAHLFLEKGLPISILKIVQFGELDKITLRFMRQILLGILLHNDVEPITSVFEKVAQSDKLKMFRESLRLFIHHFLLRNLKSEGIPENEKILLETRAKMIEKVLIAKERSIKF